MRFCTCDSSARQQRIRLRFNSGSTLAQRLRFSCSNLVTSAMRMLGFSSFSSSSLQASATLRLRQRGSGSGFYFGDYASAAAAAASNCLTLFTGSSLSATACTATAAAAASLLIASATVLGVRHPQQQLHFLSSSMNDSAARVAAAAVS